MISAHINLLSRRADGGRNTAASTAFNSNHMFNLLPIRRCRRHVKLKA